MENENQTVDLNDIVSIKLTHQGMAQVKNYFLQTYGDLGHGLYSHFIDTCVYGRIMTASIREFMLFFGNGLMTGNYFEGTEFNVVNTSFKEARKRREAREAQRELEEIQAPAIF